MGRIWWNENGAESLPEIELPESLYRRAHSSPSWNSMSLKESSAIDVSRRVHQSQANVRPTAANPSSSPPSPSQPPNKPNIHQKPKLSKKKSAPSIRPLLIQKWRQHPHVSKVTKSSPLPSRPRHSVSARSNLQKGGAPDSRADARLSVHTDPVTFAGTRQSAALAAAQGAAFGLPSNS